MKNTLDSIKIKLFLGYFILAIIVGFTGWLVFTEIIKNNNDNVEVNPVSEKIAFINNILANLYNAEGLERNLVYTGKANNFDQYQLLIDTIKYQLDSLTFLIDNPNQKKHADSIRVLLDIKQKNQQDLIFLRKNYSLNALYKKTLKQLEEEKDSIIQYYEVNQQLTKTYDTTYIKQEKKPFLNRLFKAFGNKSTEDSAMHVQISQYIQTDSVKTDVNPSDSISALLTNIGNELKAKSARAERQIERKEQAIFESDKTITLQLKEILSIVEQEELLKTFNDVRLLQEHNRKITWIIIFLGILSLITILFFGINILRDITKSQHYRQGLEAAKAETDQVLKSKEQFMLSLTHDLKTPLNAIIGFTRLIEKERINNTVNKYLKNIDRSSRHILELANHLLDLSKLQQGKLKMAKVPFNFSALIEQISENYRFGAIQKQLEFTVKNDLPSTQNYNGDPFRITQILINLVSNAIKFTHEGSVQIFVSAKTVNRKRQRITIEVVDTGIGIDKEDLPHIFEEFSRGKAENSKYEGTGLGLAITYKLVKLLHGNIMLKSEPGKGSHFTVSFPLGLSDQEVAQTSTIPHLELETKNYHPLKDLSVWLVDDDESMRKMVEAVLRTEHIRVKAFSDPTKVLEAFKEGCTDLLITDMQMPEMEGSELLKNIEHKLGTSFPAILMSGRDDHPEKEGDSTFLAFIPKPFEPDLLLQTILQHIRSIKKIDDTTYTAESGVFYSLANIKQFLGEDTDNLNKFLISYTTTSLEHIKLLDQYCKDKDFTSISELAHKMLNILHQLEAMELVDIFKILEANKPELTPEVEFLSLVKSAIAGVIKLIDKICKDEGIQLT